MNLVTNKNASHRDVVVRSKGRSATAVSKSELGLAWPQDVYSLAHVALPFPPDEPLYGGRPTGRSPGISLGSIALRGERGVLQIPPSEILRLRWNPFYPYVEGRLLSFLGLRSG